MNYPHKSHEFEKNELNFEKNVRLCIGTLLRCFERRESILILDQLQKNI